MRGVLRVVDTLGREVQAGRTVAGPLVRIDLSSMAPGSYVAMLNGSEGAWSMRFMVQ